MTDNAALIVLITHPDIDPNSITMQLGLKPTLTQKAGDQVITPRGKLVDNQYVTSKWQYKKRLIPGSDWRQDLVSLLEELHQHSEYLSQIDIEGGKNLIYFSATDFHHAELEVGPMLLGLMAVSKISFGFEFFTTFED